MRLLVIRLSAMGDVAMTTPVLAAMREKYPDAELIMLTGRVFAPFFSSVPGLSFFYPDLRGSHSGLTGLFRLFRDIRAKFRIDHVIDLHDVLRSKILRNMFRAAGAGVSVIDKGRKEKKELITGRKKVFLTHTVDRYAAAFSAAGFPVTPLRAKTITPSASALAGADEFLAGAGLVNIGVAPFAKHTLKMWPEDYMIRLLQLITGRLNCRFLLFGGREDASRLEEFGRSVPGSLVVAGRTSLETELAIISRLHLMISMDSSNMHMAAFTGTPVISIWGGTDPMAGFSAWMQPESFSISIPVEELDCRPCTIYGKGTSRNGLACMKRLTPEKVFGRMVALKVI